VRCERCEKGESFLADPDGAPEVEKPAEKEEGEGCGPVPADRAPEAPDSEGQVDDGPDAEYWYSVLGERPGTSGASGASEETLFPCGSESPEEESPKEDGGCVDEVTQDGGCVGCAGAVNAAGSW